ncbi:hypothetical protein TrLO_g10053 [Triparma laevis f. longispina]|uniref:Guanylate cyclase domain-containing protein n=1 Tax=Triparma laevis f. longispina TaxID=1714387 RepID=A0A9W7CAB2_9STRA|nr:hypothetical protein TrLO_g10053 [Triparma laevis f. longispina]
MATWPGCTTLCSEFGGSDPIFAYLSLIAFALFLVELLTNCYCVPGYWKWPDLTALSLHDSRALTSRFFALVPGSFYFWLDLLSTLSLIFEIPIFLNQLIDSANEETTSVGGGAGDDSGAVSGAEQARAGKASRAGARAGRVVKIIRMVRLIRLVKLWKYFEQSQKNENSNQVAPEEEEEDDEEMLPESHVGNEMTERTTKKVIVGILLMLIAIPNLQAEPVDHTSKYMVSLLARQRFQAEQFYLKEKLYEDDNGWMNEDYQVLRNQWMLTEEYIFNLTHPSPDCFTIEYNNFEDYDQFYTCPFNLNNTQSSLELRDSEVSIQTAVSQPNKTIDIDSDRKVRAMFNQKEFVQESSYFAALLTSCVIILLGTITMLFTADVTNLVLRPIEIMIELVREISDNPLQKEFKSVAKNDIHSKNDGMETTLILQTITKIAGLMRIGFGEAGAEIIAKNLSKSDSSGMSLLGDGVKIQSIFGFCDIRNFTDTTECLQEEVMLFVNRIAHILHGIVVQCKGAANKNIGDAFLLTWKLHENQMVPGGPQEFVADQALLSLLKTTAEMARHEDFICNFSSTALAILYERMPGYKCKMGCGLHMGWAVEGAIGSDKKIDASYISPHVNWAEFLESSTKEYGVPVLMSEPFYKLLSPSVQKWCRQVDNIKKSASDEVTGLYTYDVNPDHDFKLKALLAAKEAHKGTGRKTINAGRRKNSITPTIDTRKLGDTAKARLTMRKGTQHNEAGIMGMGSSLSIGRQRPSRIPEGLMAHVNHADDDHDKHSGSLEDAPEIILPAYTTDCWMTDEDLLNMRAHISSQIFEVWDRGMHSFISGDWDDAKGNFNEILRITHGKDGPSTNILRHIEEDYGGVTPPGWLGYRDMS